MSETLIAPLISAASAIIVCVITQIISARRTEALIAYRLTELEKKVDKHNNLVERTYKLEESTVVQAEQIRTTNRRIDALEHHHTAGGS